MDSYSEVNGVMFYKLQRNDSILYCSFFFQIFFVHNVSLTSYSLQVDDLTEHALVTSI